MNTFCPPVPTAAPPLVPAKRSVSPASSSTLSATPTLHLPPDGQGAHPPSDENLNPYGSKAKKPRLSDDSGYGDASAAAGGDEEMDVEIPDSVDGDAQSDDLLGFGGSWRDAEAFPAAPVAAPAPPPVRPLADGQYWTDGVLTARRYPQAQLGPAQSSLDALKTSLLDFQAKQIRLMDKVIEAMGSVDLKTEEGDELAYLQHNMFVSATLLHPRTRKLTRCRRSYLKQRVAELEAEIARQTLNPGPPRASPPIPDSVLRPLPLQAPVQARPPRSDSVPSSNASSDAPHRAPPAQERTVVASTSRQQLPPAAPAVVSSHFAARAAQIGRASCRERVS